MFIFLSTDGSAFVKWRIYVFSVNWRDHLHQLFLCKLTGISLSAHTRSLSSDRMTYEPVNDSVDSYPNRRTLLTGHHDVSWPSLYGLTVTSSWAVVCLTYSLHCITLMSLYNDWCHKYMWLCCHWCIAASQQDCRNLKFVHFEVLVTY